jgi:hypothetical protein
VAGIHEIDDPHIGLAGVLPMQAPSVLLQRALPGNRHRQDQRVQRRMVEALADEFSSLVVRMG